MSTTNHPVQNSTAAQLDPHAIFVSLEL
jgi:hypothetical protein